MQDIYEYDQNDEYTSVSDDHAIISALEGWQIEDFEDLVASAE